MRHRAGRDSSSEQESGVGRRSACRRALDVGWFGHSGAIVGPRVSKQVTILLEGRPGSGKSTVARRLADLLLEDGVRVGGFVTMEMRESGRRVGFSIETFDGKRATLAHVSLPGPPRVSRYGVDLDAFERIALPTLDAAERVDVMVLDELGKMELASERFCDAMTILVDDMVPLVATIHAFQHPFTDALKRREHVERLRVTRKTRDALPAELAHRIGTTVSDTRA